MMNRSEILRALRSETQVVDWEAVYESELGRIYNYFLYKLCNREVAQEFLPTIVLRVKRKTQLCELCFVNSSGGRICAQRATFGL